MGREMFVAATLGRYWYHQSRRCLSGTNTTTSIKMTQQVVRLLVDGALCPGLARVRDARERKTCCLSVALTEGAAAAFTQPSHLVSSSHHPVTALTFPITITSHARITAMLATILDTHNANAKSDLLLEHHIVFSFGRPSSQMRKHGSIKMPLVSMKQ